MCKFGILISQIEDMTNQPQIRAAERLTAKDNTTTSKEQEKATGVVEQAEDSDEDVKVFKVACRHKLSGIF